MKAARLVVLGVALVAGGAAAYVISTMGSKEPPRPVVVVAPAPVVTDHVLVAAHLLTAGNIVADGDMRWEPWPTQVPDAAIRQSLQPNAIQDFKGLFVHSDISAGELIRSAGLAKDAGVAANLPTGKRAVAIDLVDQGRNYAGGFIHQHDRVDVIRTFHPDDAPGAFASETILTNVLVLAIGQALKGASGDQAVMGSTATLELTPEQAERVVLAQRTGQLTLALRSMVDAGKDDKPAEQQTMTIIRAGNTSQSRVR